MEHTGKHGDKSQSYSYRDNRYNPRKLTSPARRQCKEKLQVAKKGKEMEARVKPPKPQQKSGHQPKRGWQATANHKAVNLRTKGGQSHAHTVFFSRCVCTVFLL